MPILVRKLDPSLTGPRKGVGLQIPFSSPSVFTVNYSSEAAIKNNILHYLLTQRGECYMNLERGFSLYEYLFEQNVERTRQELSQEIRRRLLERFPRLTQVSVEVAAKEDQNRIEINLKFRLEYSEKESEIRVSVEG